MKSRGTTITTHYNARQNNERPHDVCRSTASPLTLSSFLSTSSFPASFLPPFFPHPTSLLISLTLPPTPRRVLLFLPPFTTNHFLTVSFPPLAIISSSLPSPHNATPHQAWGRGKTGCLLFPANLYFPASLRGSLIEAAVIIKVSKTINQHVGMTT